MNKELANDLLNVYLIAIEMIKSNKDDSYWLIRDIEMSHGVCNVAYFQYREDICDDTWVQSKLAPDSAYWGTIPNTCYHKKDIIAALQLRADILAKYPN